MSSSGWMSLDVKPELDSGFLICGAPVIVALLWTGELLDKAAAAEGNVGLTGAAEDPVLKLAVGGADIVAEEDCKQDRCITHQIYNISTKLLLLYVYKTVGK